MASAQSPAIFHIFRAANASEQVDDGELQLKPEDGPWLILAASFEGTEAQQQAIDLAKELRQKFRMTAYVLPKQFDYTQSLIGSGMEVDGSPKKMKYIDDRKISGYAVLIGDFDSLDHPKLKEMLQRVKTIEPQTLSNKEQNEQPEQSVAAYKRWLRLKAGNQDANKIYPLQSAFVTRNPLLPEDFFQSPKVDKFVKGLNQNADHSLLEAKGRFTVRVATFRGQDSVVLRDSRAAQEAMQSPASEGLERAALHANLAAKVLREAGFEAFEFHDRNQSIVTVGSFDGLGQENPQGQFVYSPEIQKVMRDFGGVKEYRNSQYGPVPVPKNLLDIVNYRQIPELNRGTEAEKLARVKEYSVPFDVDPRPMAIPRPDTNRLYSNSLLGRK